MKDLLKTYKESCLYFTSNSLIRHITEIADEEFLITSLAPSYAYLMLLVIEEPGLTQNELSQKINLKPSTLTRFFEKLVQKGMVYKIHNGREVNIYATEKGNKTRELIDKALNNLYKRYCEIFGQEFAEKLTADIYKANSIIDKSQI